MNLLPYLGVILFSTLDVVLGQSGSDEVILDIGSLVSSTGGLVDKPDDLNKEDYVGAIDTVAGSFSISENSFDSSNALDLSAHLMKVIDTLGPLACLLGDIDTTDTDVMAGILGGMMGGMVASTVDMDSQQTDMPINQRMIVESAALAGLNAAVSGSLPQTQSDTSSNINHQELNQMAARSVYMPEIVNTARSNNEITDGDVKRFNQIMDDLPSSYFSDLISDLKPHLEHAKQNLRQNADKSFSSKGGHERNPCFDVKTEKLNNGGIGAAGLIGGFIGNSFSKPSSDRDTVLIIQKATPSVIKFVDMLTLGKQDKGVPDSCSRLLDTFAAAEGSLLGEIGAAMFDSMQKNSDKMMKGSLATHGRKLIQPTRQQVRETAKSQMRQQAGRFALFQEDGQMNLEKMTKCLNSIIPGMASVEMLSLMASGSPVEDLDFTGPFDEQNQNRVSKVGLPGLMMSSRWDGGSWAQSNYPKDVPPQLKRAASLPENLAKNRNMIEFVNWLTGHNRYSESPIYNYLSAGTTEIGTLSNEQIQAIPPKIIALHSPGITSFTSSQFMALLTSELAASDLNSLDEVLTKFGTSTLDPLLVDLQSNFLAGTFQPHPRVASVVADNYFSRAETENIDFNAALKTKLCAFYAGVDAFVWKEKLTSDTDMLATVYECANKLYFQMSEEQLEAIFEYADKTYALAPQQSSVIPANAKYFINQMPNDFKLTPSKVLQFGEVGLLNYLLPQTPAGRRAMQQMEGAMHQDTAVLQSVINIELLGSLACAFTEMGLQDDAANAAVSTCRESEQATMNNEANECHPDFSINSCADFKGRGGPDDGHSKGPGESVQMGFVPMTPTLLSSTSGNELLQMIGTCRNMNYAQKRAMLKRIKTDSLELHEGTLAKVRCLWPVIRKEDLASNVTVDENFIENYPEIFRNFPYKAKLAVAEALENAGSLGTKWSEDIARILPVSKIAELASNDIWSFTKIRLPRYKAMKLIQLYKTSASNGDDPLTLTDIRSMGTLAAGLTCSDIANIANETLIRAARAVYHNLGGNMPLDLAECFAVKFFLANRGKGDGDYESLFPKIARLPPSVAAMLPIRILRETQKYDCSSVGMAVLNRLKQMVPRVHRTMKMWELMSMRYCRSNTNSLSFQGNEQEVHGGSNDTIHRYSRSYADTYGNAESIGQRYPDEHDEFEKYDEAHDMNDKMVDSEYIGDISIKEYLVKSGVSIAEMTTDQIFALGRKTSMLEEADLRQIKDQVFVDAFESMRPPPEGKGNELVGDKRDNEIDIEKLYDFTIPEEDKKQQDKMKFKLRPGGINYGGFYKVAIEKFMKCPQGECAADTQPSLDYAAIARLGPGIRYISAEDIQKIPHSDFFDALSIMGRVKDWSAEQKEMLMSKIIQVMADRGISQMSNWPAESIQDMANLISIFPASSLQDIVIEDDQTFARLGKAVWGNDEAAQAILNKMLTHVDKTWTTITGRDLIQLGNLVCKIPQAEIYKITEDAIREAIPLLGRLRCLDEVRLEVFGMKAYDALGSDPLARGNVAEMGILVAGLETAVFKKVTILRDVHPNALKVISKSKLDNVPVQSLARMGQRNAEVILFRQDIFKSMSNVQKNAVFIAFAGLDAGEFASHIKFARRFDAKTIKDIEKNIELITESFYQVLQNPDKKPAFIKQIESANPSKKPSRRPMRPGGIFGMADPSQAKRPTPPPLAGGLNSDEMKDNFDANLFEDRVVVQYINKAAEGDSEIIDVLTGKKELKEITKEDIVNVPPKLLQGLKEEDVQQMTADQLVALFDSEKIARDPASLRKFLRKLDLEQLLTALEKSQEMMDETGWRPPVAIQKEIAKVYMKHKQKDKETAAANFLRGMCPYAAGIPASQINRLPPSEEFVQPFLRCMNKSYEDLTPAHKNAVIRYVGKAWGKKSSVTAQKLRDLLSFVLDYKLSDVKKAFESDPDELMEWVKTGGLRNLSTTHKKFVSYTTFILRNMFDKDKTIFNNMTIMEALGSAKCNIPLRNVKNHLDTEIVKHLAQYSIKNCKSKEEIKEEQMAECTGENAARLQRCQILEKEIRKQKQKQATNQKKKNDNRVDLQKYKMMRELADTMLSDKDLTQVTADEVREVAGVLGGMKASDLKKIPDKALLDNLDVIKENTNLTPKQKRRIMKKMESAGLETKNLAELGGLVTAVSAKKLRGMTSADLKENIGVLKENAKSMSPAQRQAIVEQLNTGKVEDLLSNDLGDLVTDIPLEKLEEIGTVNISLLNDKPWRRGQAAEIIKNFRKNKTINADLIRELGTSVVGMQCGDVMKIEVDEMYEVAIAIHENAKGGLSVDLNDCIAMRMHYSMQVINGMDYMQSSDEGIIEQVAGIPGDFAMLFMSTDLATVHAEACSALMENIGQAQLYQMPPGPGDERRKKIAKVALHDCLMEGAIEAQVILDEEKMLVLGKLICDLEPAELATMPDEAAMLAALPYLQDCLPRLSADHIAKIQERLLALFGDDASLYDVGLLTALGPLAATLPEKSIEYLDDINVFDALDSMLPPELDDDSPAKSSIHYDTFYKKVKEAVFAQRVDEARPRRWARTLAIPTADEIVSMGQANSDLTLTQLEGITADDLVNAIGTLGSITTWSDEQAAAILKSLKAASGEPSTWTTEMVGDMKELVKFMTLDEVKTLNVSDIDTCNKLGQVALDSTKREAIIDKYLSLNSRSLTTLDSSELISLDGLVCGLSVDRMIDLPISKLGSVMKNFGQLDCFSTEQFDMLKQIGLFARKMELTSSFLDEIGIIGAGLSTYDLSILEIDSLSFINSEGFRRIPAERIQRGINSTRMLAIGVESASALLQETDLFNSLTARQRNSIRLVAYGSEAELEDEPEGEEEIITILLDSTSSNLTATLEDAAQNQILEIQMEDEEENIIGGASTIAVQTSLIITMVVAYFARF